MASIFKFCICNYKVNFIMYVPTKNLRLFINISKVIVFHKTNSNNWKKITGHYYRFCNNLLNSFQNSNLATHCNFSLIDDGVQCFVLRVVTNSNIYCTFSTEHTYYYIIEVLIDFIRFFFSDDSKPESKSQTDGDKGQGQGT